MISTGKLADTRVKIWDEEDADSVHNEFYYG
jgi:hypothetical protein